MTADLDLLQNHLERLLTGQNINLVCDLGELTLTIHADDLIATMTRLRDDETLRFDMLIDLCGVDYSTYGSDISEGGAYFASDEAPAKFPRRFATVYHLLSSVHNWRLRIRTFAEDDSFPVMESVTGIWPNANWYERESFDLFGIIYTGHTDLRRLLTDYGFIGNPFRKDFPLSGNVEMRYDPEQRRIVYQPVSIEPREITPRIVREEQYGRH